MRAVNLIPPERRGVRRRSSSRSPLREPLLPLSIAVVAAAVAGIGFAAHSASSTVADRNAQIAQLDTQLAKLAAESEGDCVCARVVRKLDSVGEVDARERIGDAHGDAELLLEL